MAQIRSAPSPGSATAGRSMRLLCSLVPSHPPPPPMLAELRLLCAELKATPEGSEPAVLQSLTYLEEIVASWKAHTGGAGRSEADATAGTRGRHHRVGSSGGTAQQQADSLVPSRPRSTRATALHGAVGGIFGVDLRKHDSDSRVCDVAVGGSGTFVPRAAVDVALELAQRRQFAATHHAQQRLVTQLTAQSGSALGHLFDCVLDGSAADRQQQRAAASILCDQWADMYCVRQQQQLQQQRSSSSGSGSGSPNAKETPSVLQVPSRLILPALQEMLEQPQAETRVIACEMLINVASGVSYRTGSAHASTILSELVPVLSEVLLLLHLLGEEDDSVWSAGLDALLYFGMVTDYRTVSMSTRRSEVSAGFGLRGTPYRLDPRVLVAMLERPQLLSCCVESSAVARFLVGLLVAGLRAGPLLSGRIDIGYLETAGGIAVIGRLYAECDCVASAELLFAVLYDFAAAAVFSGASATSNSRLQRTGMTAAGTRSAQDAYQLSYCEVLRTSEKSSQMLLKFLAIYIHVVRSRCHRHGRSPCVIARAAVTLAGGMVLSSRFRVPATRRPRCLCRTDAAWCRLSVSTAGPQCRGARCTPLETQ